ncbi:THY1 Predicted alternative thymidylate synthase [uncultured Caudovirales phage]|uniref:THY1 Predicted alternative thymidylate synthase n=1 Tax=uncultured Caudovirales phage TaxID=2100421 RepID=A0A6J5MB08_9CAUD|nr:THY1 Predicted alternative thymidylate synthase [uncultured Caudovirales phage]
MMKQNVLDKGYVRLVDVLGSDLTPVNAARVSYDKESSELSDKDEKLLKFLAREGHTSPFRHAMLQFEIYAPLLTARQWWKYCIGSSHQDPMQAWNESSRRYITEEAKFYVPYPEEWRMKPENSKQGSGDPLFLYDTRGAALATAGLLEHIHKSVEAYEKALEMGICAEQARLFLPAYAMYVRWYWTASLQSVAHFINQRVAHDAQREIQEYAKAVKYLSEAKFPVSLKELLGDG